MIKHPEDFGLQGCKIAGERQLVLDRFAAGLLKANEGRTLVNIVRQLYRQFKRLPEYTLRTRKLGEHAQSLRDALKDGREPEQLLLVQLPMALGVRPFAPDQTDTDNIAEFFSRWNRVMSEVLQAYPILLRRVEEALVKGFGVEGWEDLRHRAGKLLSLVTEPRLKAFVLRASDQALTHDLWLESVAAGIVGRPAASWTDGDEERFAGLLHPLISAFHHLELLAFEKQRFTGEDQVGLRVTVTSDTGEEDARVAIVSTNESDRIEELTLQAYQLLDSLLSPEREDVRLAVLGRVAQEMLRGHSHV